MLTTMDVEVIHGTGAPSGEKHVVCWLPPETKTGERRSAYKEAVKIVVRCQCYKKILFPLNYHQQA